VVEFRLNDWGWAADTQNMPLACLDDNDGLLDSTALSDAVKRPGIGDCSSL
jgi:hypothetical protein